ncbi:MAG: hypothetical protein A2Y40_02065 [Candidatus Margulisbacteria bacterium GWF2_35_9]|nr:MAG: hypothetical protein A2Y40_02065 [Candidatus Margulisbacteria bacterium GWF2_35_9]
MGNKDNNVQLYVNELKKLVARLIYDIDYKDSLILYTLKLTNLQESFALCSPDKNDLIRFNEILNVVKYSIEHQSWILLWETTHYELSCLMEKHI